MNRCSLTIGWALSIAIALLAGCQSNKAPAAPVLTGPAEGRAGAFLSFSAMVADPDGDSVACRVAWGDGDTSDWSHPFASGGAITLDHAWPLADTYSLSAQAREARGNESPWSSGLQVVVLPAPVNEPPAVPALSGPDSGVMRETLSYGVVATDPENDPVSYRVAWGDGDTSDWSQAVASGESLTLTHAWLAAGAYRVTGQAKDRYGNRSEWSAGLSVDLQVPEYPGTVIAKVTVVPSALGICVTPDGQYLYVANYSDNTVSKVRTSDYTETKRFLVHGRPSICVLSRDGQYVYVSCSDESTVARVRVSDDVVVGRIVTPRDPWEMATSPDGNYLYAGIFRASSYKVAVLSLVDDSVVAAPVVGQNPWGMAITPDGAYLYVACRNGDAVAVLRTADRSLVATIAVGDAPNGLAISPDGQFVYVVAETSAAVYVIKTADNTVVDTIAVPDLPTGVGVLPDGKYIYVASHNSNYVSVIRTADNAIVKQIAVGSGPDRFAVAPDGSRVYVTVRGEGKVAVIGY